MIINATKETITALPIGARIVVFYSDGSGAFVLCKVRNGMAYDEAEIKGVFINTDGKDETMSSDYRFIRLPDDFKLWCEIRALAPLTLPRISQDGREA